MRHVVLSLALAALATAQGCKNKTDLNTPCELKKRNPDGGTTPVGILESELRGKSGTNKDFVSTTVDCDQSFCVRDSYYQQADAGPDDYAVGYCSTQCDEGVPNNCQSYDDALDQGGTKLNCRVLLLSAETLKQIVDSDGGSLGNIREPFFCARGQTPDAG